LSHPGATTIVVTWQMMRSWPHSPSWRARANAPGRSRRRSGRSRRGPPPEGASYGDIGRALGITRQGARKRFPRLIATSPEATTSVVAPAPAGGGGSPAGRTDGLPQPTPTTTTTVAAHEAGTDSEPPPGGTIGEVTRTPATPAEPTPANGPTTLVVTPVEPAIGSRADRTEATAARPRTSRPPKADRPRARAGSPDRPVRIAFPGNPRHRRRPPASAGGLRHTCPLSRLRATLARQAVPRRVPSLAG